MALLEKLPSEFNKSTVNKDLLDKIEIVFFESLARKTGWGKNEVMELYKESQLKVLKETIG